MTDRPVADLEHIGVHRAGYRSDCPACIANDERISARPVADREGEYLDASFAAFSGRPMDRSHRDRPVDDREPLSDNPIVLFDVDGVLLAVDGTPLPSAGALVDTLMCLGYEVHFWSAGGTLHVADALQRCGIYGSFTAHDKPTYPPTEAEALRIVGRRPALQIDDDPTERVADWPFMVWGYLASPVLEPRP